MTSSTFTYRGRELHYCTGWYNDAALNERTVEVPIARDFITRQKDPAAGLEVGNVLSHYGETAHRIVDRWEGPERLDVFDIDGTWPWIVAISTIEHVRWDPPEPRDPHGAARALNHLISLLKPGGELLVTVPFGQHPSLDSVILGGYWTPAHRCSMMQHDGGWLETAVTWAACHKPTRWARSVWVAEFAG